MKWIKTILILPLVAAIGVVVLAAATAMYLGALLVGTVWRCRDALHERRQRRGTGHRPGSGSDGDEPWELLP